MVQPEAGRLQSDTSSVFTSRDSRGREEAGMRKKPGKAYHVGLDSLKAIALLVLLTACQGSKTCFVMTQAPRTVYGGEQCRLDELITSVDFGLSSITCSRVEVTCPLDAQ